MDQDSKFMSSLMTYLLNKFGIKTKIVAPYNYQSLQTKHRIKLLSCILDKTPYKFGSEVAKVFVTCNICIQQHLIHQI